MAKVRVVVRCHEGILEVDADLSREGRVGVARAIDGGDGYQLIQIGSGLCLARVRLKGLALTAASELEREPSLTREVIYATQDKFGHL